MMVLFILFVFFHELLKSTYAIVIKILPADTAAQIVSSPDDKYY